MGRLTSEMSAEEIRSKYVRAITRDMGFPVGSLEVAHTAISTEADRAEVAHAAAYCVDAATIIRCGPHLADVLQPLASATSALSLQDFVSWGAENGWSMVDGSDTHIVTSETLAHTEIPNDGRLMALDPENAQHVIRIHAMVESCDPKDVDESEIDVDHLDPVLWALVQADGRVEALAAGRRWEEDEQFDDIAVLVRDDRRGQGWGTAVVGALCRSSFELDRLPLYRCNWSRTASKALALRLGFQRVGTLAAITPPDHNPMSDAHS